MVEHGRLLQLVEDLPGPASVFADVERLVAAVDGRIRAWRERRLLIEATGEVAVLAYQLVHVKGVVFGGPGVLTCRDHVDGRCRIGNSVKLDHRRIWLPVTNLIIDNFFRVLNLVVIVVNKIASTRNLSQMIKQPSAGATAWEVTHVSLDSIRVVVLLVSSEALPKGVLNHVERVVILGVCEPLLEAFAPQFVARFYY